MSSYDPEITSRKDFLHTEVAPRVVNYMPSDQTLETGQDIRVTVLSGPASAGKDTIKGVISDAYPDITSARSLTTRLPRKGETGYRYADINTRLGRISVVSNLDEGDFFQAISHPTTEELYASGPEDYIHKGDSARQADGTFACITDMTRAEFGRIRNLRLFRSLSGLYVVAPPDDWQARWAERRVRQGESGGMDFRNRLIEARDSLTMALDDPETTFVINDNLATAAEYTARLIRGADPNAATQSDGRSVAEEMLERAITMLDY